MTLLVTTSARRGSEVGLARATTLWICVFSASVRGAVLLVPGLLDLAWLARLSGISILMYAGYAFSSLRPGPESGRRSVFIGAFGVEWVLWSLAAVTAVGPDPGFHMLSLFFMSTIVLAFEHLPPAVRTALAALPLVAYLPIFVVVSRVEPEVTLAPEVTRLLAAGSQVAAATAVLVCAVLAIRAHARARDEAEAREMAQAQLVEDLSHELRTPVATIMTTAQGARLAGLPPERIDRALGRVEATARSMSHLVERMLDLSELDHGWAPAENDGGVADVVCEAVEEARILAAERSISVELAAEPTGRRCNRASLAIVLNNLLGNAIAHSRDGGRVEVRVTDAPALRIEVEDHGDGIAAEHLPHIFDRLWRADPVRSRGAGRHGLGLAIARRHAELLGAELEVRSVVGRGTTVTVLFHGSFS